MDRVRRHTGLNPQRCMYALLAMALMLRLGLATAVQRQVDQPPVRLCLIAGDAEGYWELAQKIVSHQDYAIYQPPRYVERVPGFPVLLTISQSLFGANPFAARCLLACLGTAACGLTYWLGRELADSSCGLIAAAYTALSPTQALFSILILSETTFAAAILASLIAIARIARIAPEHSAALQLIGGGALAGILIGLATLVRPTWLYVGTFIALAALFVPRPQTGQLRQRLLIAASLLLGVGAALAPWTIRNYRVTGHVVPTTLWVGASLYDGLNPNATGDSDMQFVGRDRLRDSMSEYDMDREYRNRALTFAWQNPGQVVSLALKKQLRYWSLVPNAAQFQNKWIRVAVCLAVLPLFIFAAIGIWSSRSNFNVLLLTCAPIVLFAGLHLLFVGSLRYRLPAEFPLAVIAAIGIQYVRQRLFFAGTSPTVLPLLNSK